ncbi:unnamed protein product [Taenia asiatica]|uniref:Uncharacterized protein n=1 Tax=Taenia asiatica TaxID=60517 RepID=A0A0R3W4H2_TAEAS|nr:unnamed protein product [Taenia asiatica]
MRRQQLRMGLPIQCIEVLRSSCLDPAESINQNVLLGRPHIHASDECSAGTCATAMRKRLECGDDSPNLSCFEEPTVQLKGISTGHE